MILVSVCIANYNGDHLLRDCIDSVLAQDLDGVEVIVHDDASTDGSLPLLRESYPTVTLIASGENVGFCVANNRMVAASRGKFVLLLNNDAALMPGALRALVDDAKRHDDGAILTLPQYDWNTGALVDRGCLLDPFHVPVPNLDPDRTRVAYVIGACLWIPVLRWRQLGGFPEWFGSIAEDMHLCCAARLQGVPVRCVAAGAYRHRQGASFGGNRADEGGLRTRYRRRYLSERNRLWLVRVYLPAPLVWPWLCLHVTALVLEGVLLAIFLRDSAVWRQIYGAALADTWRSRGLLARERVRLQSTRNVGTRTLLAPYRWIPRKLVLLLRHGLPRIR